MDLIDRLKEEIKKAVLAKDKEKAEKIRYFYSLLEKEKMRTGQLSQERAVAILRREMKRKEEAIALFEKGGRPDLAEKEREEKQLLASYLPQELDEDEVRKIVRQLIKKEGGGDFGAIMGKVMGQLKGKAEGSLVARVVKEELNHWRDDRG